MPFPADVVLCNLCPGCGFGMVEFSEPPCDTRSVHTLCGGSVFSRKKRSPDVILRTMSPFVSYSTLAITLSAITSRMLQLRVNVVEELSST